MENKRLLVVDDTQENLDILKALLDEYTLFLAHSGEEALMVALKESIDLVILDIVMPKMNGFEVCKLLKKDTKTSDIPVIFMTVKTDEESIKQSYEAGGIDYITKPFKPTELLMRVKTQLEMRDLIQHLQFISYHDTLTGIYNRRKFFEEGMQRFSNKKSSLYACIIDIDDFKLINDSFGHAFGDTVIKGVASAIADKMSENMLFGRIGGDEFAILGYFVQDSTAFDFFSSLCKSVKTLEFANLQGKKTTVTLSIGVSTTNDASQTLDHLLYEADMALYRSKQNGKDATSCNSLRFRMDGKTDAQ